MERLLNEEDIKKFINDSKNKLAFIFFGKQKKHSKEFKHFKNFALQNLDGLKKFAVVSNAKLFT